ncbi:MAG: RNA polymerase subunit sigma-70 [Archangium sp.]|nr:RNA polymerase subunit sigma-70 [Archangium sp.]
MIDFDRDIAPQRTALRSYCYRLLGTLADADDAAQEALVRAWKARDRFEGRSSIKTWLFQIASRVCFDQLSSRARRSMPDLERGPASPTDPTSPDGELAWLEPAPDAWLEPEAGPEATIAKKQSIALAFLVALQALPPLQRAVLVLREVLGHSAIETAEVLESTVPAVNSALQRARATLESMPVAKRPTEAVEQSLLARYLNAWERSDIKALVSTLREDASLVMPPMAQWFAGAENIAKFLAQPFLVAPEADAARFKGVVTRASGFPAVALFRRASPDAPWLPDSLHVLELDGELLGRLVIYVTPALHAAYGVNALPS